MAILVLNAGSSSLKYAVVDSVTGRTLRRGNQTVTAADLDPAVAAVLAALPAELAITGVGHRVVHGGERFVTAVRIDDEVEAGISDCARLAPLHNPVNLAAIRAARRHFPHLPHVAVFDTAFHQTLPEVAWRYAVPQGWYEAHGVRRYGFHGTSHRFVAARAAELLGRDDLHLVTAHLGNGCSACAVRAGVSCDTTMGLTPLEGLVMGTRSGDLDPGILAHVARETGRDLPSLISDLNQRSGLLGLSGLSNDLRQLTTAANDGHHGAQLAIAVFCHRLAKAIAGLATSLDRLDALVFTGGIGEHSAEVRAQTIARLGILGLELDPTANAAGGEGRITRRGTALIIPTDEELVIARDTQALI